MRILNVSTLWGTIAVSASQGTQEMATTVQVCGLECEVLFYHSDTTADVDECAKSSHGCSRNAYCNNTDGGYWCECWPGFQGDRYNCTGL